MEDLADIINVAIEELVRGSFELPGFSTLHKEAKLGRTEVNRGFYQRVQDAIGANGRTAIDTLLSESGSQSPKTRWDSLKQDARSPRLTHLRNLLDRQQWLALERPAAAMNSLLPEVKLRQFALEARRLDAGHMQEMAPAKRYTLAATLIELQSARVLDDLTEMFIKRMMRIHRLGREALALDRLKYQERTDRLVHRLHEVILAWSGEGSSEQRLEPLVPRLLQIVAHFWNNAKRMRRRAATTTIHTCGAFIRAIDPHCSVSGAHSNSVRRPRTSRSKARLRSFWRTRKAGLSGSPCWRAKVLWSGCPTPGGDW
jgi:hypothetical protein